MFHKNGTQSAYVKSTPPVTCANYHQ